MPYTFPGQAYDRTLTALKGWYKEMALDAEVIIGANVNINSNGTPATPGLVVHCVSFNAAISPYGETIDGPGTFVCEMGANKQMPIFLWSSPTDPDVSNPGVPAGTPAYGNTAYPDPYISTLPRTTNQHLVGLVATGGYEVESTEYDPDQTYAANDGLRTVTSNTDANAGKVTNQAGATPPFNSSGAAVYGNPAVAAWDTIVGIVSRGEYTNANRRPVLAYWTVYLPGTR